MKTKNGYFPMWNSRPDPSSMVPDHVVSPRGSSGVRPVAVAGLPASRAAQIAAATGRRPTTSFSIREIFPKNSNQNATTHRIANDPLRALPFVSQSLSPIETVAQEPGRRKWSGPNAKPDFLSSIRSTKALMRQFPTVAKMLSRIVIRIYAYKVTPSNPKQKRGQDHRASVTAATERNCEGLRIMVCWNFPAGK